MPQEPDLTKEQPGDAGYLAAVRAALEQLSTGRGAGKSTPPAAGASAAAAAAAPASGDAAQAGGSGADAGGSTSVAGATEVRPGPRAACTWIRAVGLRRWPQKAICVLATKCRFCCVGDPERTAKGAEHG